MTSNRLLAFCLYYRDFVSTTRIYIYENSEFERSQNIAHLSSGGSKSGDLEERVDSEQRNSDRLLIPTSYGICEP